MQIKIIFQILGTIGSTTLSLTHFGLQEQMNVDQIDFVV